MDGTPLHQAASDGEIDEVRRLLEAGADVNARSGIQATPLHWAVQGSSGNLDVLSVLVDHGADVNAQNSLGYTPLHFASLMGSIPVAQRLLDLGADTSVPDKYNQTAEDMARGKAKTFFAERKRRKAERKVNAKGLAMVSVSKQLPYELTRKIGEALDAKPKTFTPQSAKGRKTRARKTKRRLTRRRK